MKHDENCTHAVVASNERKSKKNNKLGDVTSLNITTLQAGVRVGDTFAYNCVPPVAKCSLDIRISPHMEPIEMKNLLDRWCMECSSSKGNQNTSKLTWDFLEDQNSSMSHATTVTDRQVNPWYGVFCDALVRMGCSFPPKCFLPRRILDFCER
jgi:aminoacylase